MELKAIISYHNLKCSLVIGMHAREGFTRAQYEAAENLAVFLKSKNLGEVRVCTAFKFHGKVYSFRKSDNPLVSILGSSNITGIASSDRQFETDILFDEEKTLDELKKLHDELVEKATKVIPDEWSPSVFRKSGNLLEGHEGVERCVRSDLSEAWSKAGDVQFKIPLKTEQKSNLNVYFGRGRLAFRTGAIRPRPWYEVELIVPNTITRQKYYPQAGSVFDVITDDGWKFACKISGDFSKNFRSNDDLRTLGKWIKGRLETDGILKVGELVTEEMLDRYGRHDITFTKSSEEGVWLLDFSSP